MGRSSTSPKSDSDFRVLTVRRTAVRIHSGGPGYQGAYIQILADMDKPVLRETCAELSVDQEGKDRELGGFALGVTVNTWRVAVTLHQAHFASLLGIVATGQLSHVGLLVDRILRGKARVRFVTFSTDPIEPTW